MKNCDVCKERLESTFRLKEMMLGMQNEFEYAQCPRCGTIQIINVPVPMEPYYPEYYYSFNQEIPKLKPLPFFKRLFTDFRIKRKYNRRPSGILNDLKPLQILPSQKILDIGCGKGILICEMFNQGFWNIQGVDKYIDKEYNYDYGVTVLKKDLSELNSGSFDLLMMHHVFEHMDRPYEELCKCYDLLKDNGNLMIRIPVVGKAWDIYRENWVQLDAPRHFFIHTEDSMRILAEKAGFTIIQTVYDSTAFQFWGSELYNRNISLVDKDSKQYIKAKDFFSDEDLAKYENSAHKLNQSGQGDQAVFYLRKRA